MESEDDVLSLPHSKLRKIPNIKKEVRDVILYHNKITAIESSFSPNVRFLDLSDNLIKKIGNLENFPKLEKLDLGYNLLTEIINIESLPLKDLFLMCNDIEKIKNLNIPTLRNLDLACNNIEKIENLECINLEELYLGNNQIKAVENINHLSKLRVLSLQNNLLQTVDCSQLPCRLNILLLNENQQLTEIKNLNKLSKLEYLDISKTGIKECQIDKRDGLEVVFR